MKRFSLMLIALLSASFVGAQTTESLDKGSTAMAFALLPSGPSRAGVAEAGVNVPGSSAGVYYLSYTPGSQQGVSADFSLGLGDKLNVSAGFMMLKSESYQEINASGNVIGEYSPSDMKITAGVSYDVLEWMSAGVGVHYLRSALASDATLSAFCADLSATASLGQWKAGLGLFNVGPAVKGADGTGYPLPTRVRADGQYLMDIGQASAISFGLSGELFFSAGLSASAGAEYSFRNMLFARVGAHLGGEVLPSYVSLGLGVKFAGISLDAAYLLASETLGGSLVAGLSYSF